MNNFEEKKSINQSLLLKIIRSKLLVPVILYTTLSLILVLKTNLNIPVLTSDFHFYHSFWHNYLTSIPKSGLSQILFEASGYSQNLVEHRQNWVPNPFYSTLFLWPIAILGSKATLLFSGWAFGVLSLLLITAILDRKFKHFGRIHKIIVLGIIASNPIFIHETVGLSTNGVCTLLLISIVFVSRIKSKIILASAALLIRPNMIFLLAGWFISNLIINRRRSNILQSIKLASIPLALYILMYFAIYQSYPGSGWNYIFQGFWPGISYVDHYSQLNFDLFKNLPTREIFSTDLTFLDAFRLITKDLSAINFFVQTVLLKISVFLGFGHSQMYESSVGGGAADVYSSLSSVFFTIPGFYCAFILFIFSASRNMLCRVLYGSTIMFVLFNCIFMGIPRMSVPVLPCLAIALAETILYIQTMSKNLPSSNY